MNLYLLTQDAQDGYDTYDSVVVCAETEDEARMIHPSEYRDDWDGKQDSVLDSWCNAEDVKVAKIGMAAEHMVKGVVLASFNAG